MRELILLITRKAAGEHRRVLTVVFSRNSLLSSYIHSNRQEYPVSLFLNLNASDQWASSD